MATNTTMTNIPNQPPSAAPSSAPQPKEVKVVSVTETTQQPPAQQGQCSSAATNADPVPANMQAEYAQAQSAINQK